MEESLTDGLEKKLKSVFGDVLLALVFSFIRPIATLTEVFFRKQMGERYFNAWNYFAGFILISAVRSPYAVVTRGQIPVANILAFAWGIAFAVCIYLHKEEVKNRYRDGIRWHSYCYGLPRIEKLPAAIERAIPIVIGVMFIVFRFMGIGGLLVLSGMISITLRTREVQEFRNRMLDKIDAQIEHDNLEKTILENLPPQQTEGLRAPVPGNMSKEAREQFVNPADCESKQERSKI